ncbi:hypothetical protein D3C71_674420 [compost metagenome]
MLKKHLISFCYFLTALTFVTMGFFQAADEALDISIGDTYFVISKTHLLFVLAAVFLIFGGISLLFYRIGKPLLNGLSITHLLMTLIGLICLYHLGLQIQPVREFYDYSVADDFDKRFDTDRWFILVSFVSVCIVIAQLVLLINVTIAVFRKSKF